MRTKTFRPIELKCRNNVYYPEGLPADDDPQKTSYFVQYFDENFNKYAICYTQKQVENIVKINKLFSPFIPFHFS